MVGEVFIADYVRVEKDAKHTKCNVVCDALILDPQSRSDTYPYIEVLEQDVSMGTRQVSHALGKSNCSI